MTQNAATNVQRKATILASVVRPIDSVTLVRHVVIAGHEFYELRDRITSTGDLGAGFKLEVAPKFLRELGQALIKLADEREEATA